MGSPQETRTGGEAVKVTEPTSVNGNHYMAARAWLEEVKLHDTPDPNVAMLLGIAQELEDVEAGEYDLGDKDRLATARGLRKSLLDTRRALQALVDRADSLASMERHQHEYGRVAAESLGFIDFTLLDASAQKSVIRSLTARGYDMGEWGPTTRRA